MKKIGFIGAYDKIDFIIYIAKILVELGKRVVVVDATLTQKAKYIVPAIKPSRTYVTEFEGIDIAVGIDDFSSLKKYLALPNMAELPYDIALIDIDTIEGVENFEIEEFDKNFFVTSFDMYSIKKGLESICSVKNPVKATKVLFAKDILEEENDYLNFLSLGSKIEWEDEIIYFPFEVGDQTVIYTNQRVSKIKFKRLSNQFKEGLMYVCGKIEEDEGGEALVRKAFKKIEKGV
ncbi:MAG: hypothetical protein J6M60_05585 [Clostridia bacterium]|nr:hypothetical protein [Clostridia bacterium]